MDSIIYSASPKDHNKSADVCKNSIFHLVRRVILSTKEVPYSDVESCCDERMTRWVSIFKAASIRPEVSDEEWARFMV
jgi:hypothetical protein